VRETVFTDNLQLFNTSASAVSGTGSHVFSDRLSRFTAS